MNLLLYNIAIYSYKILIYLFSSFNRKAALFVNGRKDMVNRLAQDFDNTGQPVAWFHCASLGEFEQGRPVIEAFRGQFPGYKILLTFFSPSGYEVRKNYDKADWVYYLPLDTVPNARHFIQTVNPAVVFFVKYEFWYHYLNELSQRNIPVILFSAIFRRNQVFFKPYGRFFRDILKKFTHIFVQDADSARLLRGIDITAVSIGGDTRFDRVKSINEQRKAIPVAARFKDGKTTLVAGSTWQKDLSVIAPFVNQFKEELKVIIAPHEISEANLREVETAFQKKVIRFSAATAENAAEAGVLLIDNVGMLSSLYQYGEFAYIGGAFGKGLHNTLEAAVYGMPVFFGNLNYEKFREATELEHEGVAFPVADTAEFGEKFSALYRNTAWKKAIGTVSAQYVNSRTGATRKVIEWYGGIRS